MRTILLVVCVGVSLPALAESPYYEDADYLCARSWWREAAAPDIVGAPLRPHVAVPVYWTPGGDAMAPETLSIVVRDPADTLVPGTWTLSNGLFQAQPIWVPDDELAPDTRYSLSVHADAPSFASNACNFGALDLQRTIDTSSGPLASITMSQPTTTDIVELEVFYGDGACFGQGEIGQCPHSVGGCCARHRGQTLRHLESDIGLSFGAGGAAYHSLTLTLLVGEKADAFASYAPSPSTLPLNRVYSTYELPLDPCVKVELYSLLADAVVASATRCADADDHRAPPIAPLVCDPEMCAAFAPPGSDVSIRVERPEVEAEPMARRGSDDGCGAGGVGEWTFTLLALIRARAARGSGSAARRVAASPR